jgi:prepilin-type N-terminal cleavage/methylation domain-containing protein
MQSAELRTQNAEQNGCGNSLRLRNRRSFCALRSALCTLRFRSAFTLIELMVAVGLMAILLTMIATIFSEATQAFRVARASIQIHESARAAFNALVDDLTAAEFTAYDNGVQGYFALSQGPTNSTTGATGSNGPGLNWRGAWSSTTSYAVNDLVSNGGISYNCIAANTNHSPPNATYWYAIVGDTLTFTTLAPQPGARYAAPEAVEQLALVRYSLEFDGGSATLPGSRTPRPTFNLVKRVRFPNTGNTTLNMDDFNVNDGTLQTEVNLSDPNWTQYAQPEPIAFHVLSMNVRLFCLPLKSSAELSEAFVETDFANSGTATSLTDTSKTWTSSFAPLSLLRIFSGTEAGQWATIQSNTTNMISLTLGTGTLLGTGWTTFPDTTSQYRVDGLLVNLFSSNPTPPVAYQPAWCQRVSTAYNYNFFGTTYRPPAIVEVTLEMTDVRATRSFIFTQRLYIPASER